MLELSVHDWSIIISISIEKFVFNTFKNITFLLTIEYLQKLNEEVDYLKIKNERLEKHRTECLAFEEKITDLVKQLNKDFKN